MQASIREEDTFMRIMFINHRTWSVYETCGRTSMQYVSFIILRSKDSIFLLGQPDVELTGVKFA